MFDWTIDDTNDPDYGLVEASGGPGGGIMQVREDRPPFVTFYVSVDDLDAALARVTELGGAEVLGPTPIPGFGAFALFSDPEGNVLGLFRVDAE